MNFFICFDLIIEGGKKRPIEDENDKNESENKTIKISKNNGHDGDE